MVYETVCMDYYNGRATVAQWMDGYKASEINLEL